MTAITAQQAGNQQDLVESVVQKFSNEAKALLAKQHQDLKTASETELAKTNAALNVIGAQLSAAQAESKRLSEIVAGLEVAPRKKAPDGSREMKTVTRTLGHMVTRSAEYAHGVKTAKRMVGGGSKAPLSFGVKVGSIWGKARNTPANFIEAVLAAHAEGKSLDIDDDTAGTAVIPQYIPGVIELPKLTPMIRLLVPVLATSETNLIRMDREKRQLPLAAKVTATSSISDTTINVDNISAFSTATGWNSIRLDNGSDPIETNAVTTITANTNGDGGGVLTVTAIGIALAVGDIVYAARAGVTPEGDLAPRMVEEFEDYEVPVCELSAFIRANAVKLDDITYMEKYINDRLLAELARREDLHCFYGPGGAGKITGIFADSAVETHTRTSGTYQDHIISGIYRVWNRFYQPKDCVVALNVHEALTVAKDSTGRYLFWTDQQAGTPMRVHTVALHGHHQLEAGDGVVGDFQMGCTLFDREESTVEIGYNNDDLQRRKKTVIAHERLAFAIEQPDALTGLAF